jgi:8-oxo-dGTP pyrophosphatase MutT (NUDIX family)
LSKLLQMDFHKGFVALDECAEVPWASDLERWDELCEAEEEEMAPASLTSEEAEEKYRLGPSSETRIAAEKPKAVPMPQEIDDDGWVTPQGRWIHVGVAETHADIAADFGFRGKDPVREAIDAGYVRVVVWLEKGTAFLLFRSAADALRRAGEIMRRFPAGIGTVGMEYGQGKFLEMPFEIAEEKFPGGSLMSVTAAKREKPASKTAGEHILGGMPNPLTLVDTRPDIIEDWVYLPERDRKEMLSEAKEIMVDPNDLKTDQLTVGKDEVEELVKNIGSIDEPTESTDEEHLAHPLVLGTDQGMFVFDGNHRCSAAKLAGVPIKVLYINLHPMEDLVGDDDWGKTGVSKLASIDTNTRVLYHGTNKDEDFNEVKPDMYGILWLAETDAAQDYTIRSYREGEPRLFEVRLKSNTKLIDIRDLSDPIVREYKEVEFPDTLDAEYLERWATWRRVEGSPKLVKFMKDRGVDGVIVNDQLKRGRPHDSVALFNRDKIESQKVVKTADRYNPEGFWAGEGDAASGILPVCPATGRVGLAMRSGAVDYPHTYSTVGGAVKSGMSPQQSAKAELKEETGYGGGINLIPAYTFASGGGFKYHNFIGVVGKEFGLHPQKGESANLAFEDENVGIDWVPFQEVLDDIKANSGKYHPEFAKFLANSEQAIRRALREERHGVSKKEASGEKLMPGRIAAMLATKTATISS